MPLDRFLRAEKIWCPCGKLPAHQVRRETVRDHLQGPFLRQRLRSQSILLDSLDIETYPTADILQARLATPASQAQQRDIVDLEFTLPGIEEDRDEDEDDLDLINIDPTPEIGPRNSDVSNEEELAAEEGLEEEQGGQSEGEEFPEDTDNTETRPQELDSTGFYPLKFFDDTPLEVYKAQANKPSLDGIKSCAIVNFIARMEGGGSERLLTDYTKNFNFLLEELLIADGERQSIPLHDSVICQLKGYTRLDHIRIDCCSSNCCAYTGSYRNLTHCPYCGDDRYFALGQVQKSKKTWDFTSLIRRFRTMYADIDTSKELQRQDKEATSPIVADVWDAHYIKSLRSEGYFRSYRDLALGLSHDGIQLFKIGDFEVTPILITVFNFRREHRYDSKHQIVVGIIPGPSQPKDLNSFMVPVVDELKLLETGILAWDAARKEEFILKANLVMLQADSPAMNKVINFVGFQGYAFCSHCLQIGVHHDGAIRCPHSKPKDLPNRPGERPSMQHYDVLNPTMRTHGEWLTAAQHISLLQFDTEAERDREIRACKGIKGFSPFLLLRTIRAPYSFALDGMHILLANIEPLIFDCWAGSSFSKSKKKSKKHASTDQRKTKAAFADDNDYHIPLSSWKKIAGDQKESWSSMPSSIGPSLKPVTTHHTRYTAGHRLQWILQSPILLRDHLATTYYESWCSFVKVIQEILQPYDRNRIPNIRTSLALFVLEFERLYYRREV